MRRLIVTLGVLAGCLSFTSVATAKTGCVLTPERHVVCGTMVRRGYRPPPPVVHRPPMVVKCRRGYARVNGVCVVRRPTRVHRTTLVCRRGYVLRGRVCVRVRRH